ncbi:MAG: thioesterase family protein [Verrucomicrobiae bacterium]|jgi:YbgC/YbaW family acyl-CoA thioester hydrolase|nr:thioesterase family protein [Verrucomicrobiae bacterium]
MSTLDNSILFSEQHPMMTPISVMFYDTDAAGVVHNIAYLRFIETARTLLALEYGMDWATMKETSVFPVVLRTEIDYRYPALLGDLVEVESWIGEISAARFWCHFNIHRPSDGLLLVTCKQSLAFVKMPEGKVQRLPKGFPTPFIPRASRDGVR